MKTTNKRHYLFSLETTFQKFFVSGLVFFAYTPPKHDISVQNFFSADGAVCIFFSFLTGGVVRMLM
jgi:hypothetical protein